MSLNIGTQAIQLPALPRGVGRTLTNIGSVSCYFGTASVSSTSNSGVIPAGGSMTLVGNPYLVSTGAGTQIEDITGVDTSGSWPAEEISFASRLGTPAQGTVLVTGASIELNEGGEDPVNPALVTLAQATIAQPTGTIQWARWIGGLGLRIVRNAANSGLTSSQALANMTNPAHAQYCMSMNPPPGIVYLGLIEGDDPGTLTPAQSAANVLTAFTLFRAAYPAALIVLPTYPGVNIATSAATRAVVNPLRRLLAQQNPNTLLFDFEALFTNPVTGLPVVLFSQDQIHPNPVGAAYLGAALATALAPYVPASTNLVNDYTNDPRVSAASGGWTTDAMFTGAPGANASGANWVFAGPAGAVRNLVARTDGVAAAQYGNWQEMVYGGTAGQMKMTHTMPANVPAGAVMQVEGQVQFEGNLAAGSITDISLIANFANAGFASIASSSGLGNALGNQGPYTDLGAGKILTVKGNPCLVPAGHVGANSPVTVAINGTATAGGIKFSRVSLVRVA